MTNAFKDLDIIVPRVRPSDDSLTMVLDKGLGLRGLEDLLDSASQWIDIIKLGWGTSAVMPRGLIAAKIALIQAAGLFVCPGGTLLELAWLRGKTRAFFAEAAALGFSCVEVSDGTVFMPPAEKLRLIGEARDAGFRVLSEVGSKIQEADQRITVADRVSAIKAERAAGAWKVIMEARESGTHGIFDGKGATQSDMLASILAEVDASDVLFEAPQRHQQTDLIFTIGPKVNLGNIAPADVVPLQTLRTGLRSDTLGHFHDPAPCVRIGLGASDAREASMRGDVIVVIDALRASSTIVAALAAGARAVVPVARIEECVGEVTAGERGGLKVTHVDLDNSPTAMRAEVLTGRELVLTTTNGTECILAAATNESAVVLIGALTNASAVGQAALALARENRSGIALICAGRNNQMAPEDLFTASEIALSVPGARIVGEIRPMAPGPAAEAFLESPSGRNLFALGRVDDILHCASRDTFRIVPRYAKGRILTVES
jgi:phosphosulfolactate synthase (CoM biosynthesis protein A)/phosphosulfolactate phosphohydrolase-like enzyme